MHPALGFSTGAGGSGEKGCSGDGGGVQCGAIPSFNSVEPRLPCSGPGQTRPSLRLESPSPRSPAGRYPEARPSLPTRPQAVRAAAAAACLPPAPLLSPPPPTRGRPRPQSRNESRRSLNRDAGWVREAFGALWPGTRGESCGPRASGLGYAVGGRGRCWRDGTAWDRGEGPSPGEPPPQLSPSRCPLPP